MLQRTRVQIILRMRNPLQARLRLNKMTTTTGIRIYIAKANLQPLS